jgi:23S rRNA (uracil1939-C5)-methyltransferase
LSPGLEAQVRPPLKHRRDGELWLSEAGESGMFEQANAVMNRRLVADIVREAAVAGSPILELYAGSGNFTVPLAMAGQSGVAIENDGRAALLLAGRLGPEPKVRIHASDVAVVVPTLPAIFATVLLDPPRVGARAMMPEITRLGPRRILYVSCDAPTLARDLASLTSRYRLVSVMLYDFMPQTAHVELLAILELISGA